MTDEQTPETAETKERKPTTPNIDKVLAAIGRGDYDDRVQELITAASERNKMQQERVLQRVREVFGPDAHVVTEKGVLPDMPLFASTEPPAGAPQEVAPEAGMIKVLDADGNETWQKPAEPENPFLKTASDAPEDINAKLDQVEAEMQPVAEIERRGAMIGGVHSSDIGD